MKKDRKETLLSETGSFLIDIAKLVFGGVILAGIMEYENLNPFLLFGLGSVSVFVFFIAGLILMALSKTNKED